NGKITLKNWYLNPSRYEHKQFVNQSNENLDDIPNAFSDFEVEFEFPINYSLASNLAEINSFELLDTKKVLLNAKNKSEVAITIQPNNTYQTYKNEII